MSLKFTKATAPPGARSSSKHHDIYIIEAQGAQGAQERGRRVVCTQRRQEVGRGGSQGCTGCTGCRVTPASTEGGSSTGEQSMQGFDSSAGGLIAGEQGNGSSREAKESMK